MRSLCHRDVITKFYRNVYTGIAEKSCMEIMSESLVSVVFQK